MSAPAPSIPSGCLLLLCLLPGLSAGTAHGQADPSLSMRVLKANCLSCHNDGKRKGGLSLDSREALMAGGDEGLVVVEGDPDKSRLITSLSAAADPHMPPKKQLGPAPIKLLSDWVRAGAPWDAAALAGQSPPRAVSLTPLPETYRPVLAMALSPDGSRLAAGCGNQILLFENKPEGLVLRGRAQAHPDPVQAMAWSADGRSLVSGAFRRVVVWDAESLILKREILTGLTDRISVILTHPGTGHAVLADGPAGESGMVRELDPETGEIIRSWQAHDDTVYAMALSADGTKLATGGGDKLVKLWDWSTGSEISRMEAHSTQVMGLAFNPDHTLLVTGGADRQLKVWDVNTRENISSLPDRSSAIQSLQWNAAGPAVFAVMEDGALLKYSDFKAHTGAERSEGGKEKRLGQAGSVLYCLTVSQDGSRIFAGTRDSRILGWNQDGKLTDDIPAAATTPPAPVSPP